MFDDDDRLIHSSNNDIVDSPLWLCFMTNMSSSSRRSALDTFCHEHCTYLPAMLGWFLFSAILSTYNKFVFGDGHMHFPCPLFLTSIHFSIQWAFSHIACAIWPIPLGADRIANMSWKEWASISIPCGMVTALDVGLSNLALVTITLTFYTMVKSSTPVFVLVWAYLFNIERITWSLIGVIVVIASGEFLTVYGEVNFVLHGFLLCLVASVLSGARWTLVQLKLQRLDPPLKSTIVTMKLLAPSMFWSMLLISMVVERPWNTLKEEENFEELARVFLLGLLGGSFAVFMILCEFYLILRASAIILMIGGVIKELTTIIVGVLVFKDKLNIINTSGVLVVFSGVILYKVVFHLEKKKKQQESMEAILTDEEDEDVEFMTDDMVIKQNLTGEPRGFKDHESDEEGESYSDEVHGTSRPEQSVEMVENSNGALHLRTARHQRSMSPSSSLGDDSIANGII
jgi:solute carrier family 35, member C2